jgi:hypothetical protein
VTRPRGLPAFVFATCLLLAACSSGATSSSAASTGAPTSAASPVNGGKVPRFGHVFLVIGENTERSEISTTSMPYLAETLGPTAASLTNYDAVTHASLANYVAMTSGQYTSCQQDDRPPSECHQAVDSLFAQLDAAGLTWRAWMQSMPSPCGLEDSGGSGSEYAVKHDPAVYYDGIEGTGGQWSATQPSAGCLANVLPTGAGGTNDTSALDQALASGDVGDFNLIVPNLCEDAHDNCGGSPVALTQFDDFLAREVPKILASPAFGRRGVLIVTFDEGTTDQGGGGNVGMYVRSSLVTPGTNDQRANHYSLLRTLEQGFGISTYLGGAASAAPFSGIWRTG